MNDSTPTYRTVRVSGDWLAEDADFTRFASFEAKVRIDPETGDPVNWNGFAEPYFSIDEAKRLAKWIDETGGGEWDGDRISVTEDEDGFVGVEIVPADPEAYDGIDTHVSPVAIGGEGFFPLHFGWTWTIDEEEAR